MPVKINRLKICGWFKVPPALTGSLLLRELILQYDRSGEETLTGE